MLEFTYLFEAARTAVAEIAGCHIRHHVRISVCENWQSNGLAAKTRAALRVRFVRIGMRASGTG